MIHTALVFMTNPDDRPAKNDSYSFLGENRLNLPT